MRQKIKRSRNSIGQCRYQLVTALEKELEKQGYTVRIDPADIEPTRGYWAQQDVNRWEGVVEVLRGERWAMVNIYSWDKMVDCVKHGVEVKVHLHKGIEVHAKGG